VLAAPDGNDLSRMRLNLALSSTCLVLAQIRNARRRAVRRDHGESTALPTPSAQDRLRWLLVMDATDVLAVTTKAPGAQNTGSLLLSAYLTLEGHAGASPCRCGVGRWRDSQQS
jgi:hypothetical protein